MLKQLHEYVETLDLMKAMYFKGFGNLIWGIFYNCEASIETGFTDSTKKDIVTDLKMIMDHYSHIPMTTIIGIKDFAPIVVIKELLDEFEKNVKSFLIEPEKTCANEINQIGNTIMRVAELFRNRLKMRLAKLRTNDEYKDYKLRMVDFKGDTFYI